MKYNVYICKKKTILKIKYEWTNGIGVWLILESRIYQSGECRHFEIMEFFNKKVTR